MKRYRLCLLHSLWPAIILLAGLVLAMSMTSAKTLPESNESSDTAAEAPGAIEGFVYAPDSTRPVVGAWVNMHHEEANVGFGAETGAGGYFTITELLPGPYIIDVRPPAGSTFASAVPRAVEIRSGQWASETLHLTDPLISGYVRDCDAVPERRIPGAVVVAHTKDWSFEVVDVTDINGEFKLGGMATGVPIILEVFPPPESEYVPVGPREVTPPVSGEILELCIPPLNVVGTVHDPTGGPVPGAGVVVWRGDFWRETAADQVGDFGFRGLPTGTLRLQAAPPWGPAGEGLLPTPVFTVEISQPDTLVDVGVLTLPPAVKTVSGQVLNAATGGPVNDAVVVAHRLDRPGFVDGPVRLDGTFTLFLPGGEWHLSVDPMPPPAPPAEWIFAGPPAWVPFLQPPDVPEDITGVVLEVIPTNAWVIGEVVCPSAGEPCPPTDAIWVELRNDEIGNGAGVGGGPPSYPFAIPIPGGWYELIVHVDHPAWQGPEPRPVRVQPGDNPVDPIPLLLKDARITGQVRNELGSGVPGVRVFGWQPEGFGWSVAETDLNGDYVMRVIGGEWLVEPQPLHEQPFVFRERPRLVRVAPGGTMTGIDFQLTGAESRIRGGAVDANTREPLWGLDGWAWAERIVAPDRLEFFSDAPMRDSLFELKVRGGQDYLVGVDVPPHAPYVSGGTGPIGVPPLSEVAIEVPLEHKDAAVQGHLIDVTTGSPPKTGRPIWAEVFGEDERGHWVVAGVDPDSAGYELGVISGTWHLRTWVDPESGYVAIPTTTVAIVQSGQVASPVDFPVWPINAVIRGTVRAPDGAPVEAFVFAEGESPHVGYFETRAWSDPNGRFELVVPEGGYIVGAALPGDELETMGWLNPRPIDVPSVAAGQPARNLELRFRRYDGEIHGTISFAAGIVETATHPAYVWGWADSGEWAETEALVSGANTFTYSLRVVSDTVWHVGAVYEDPDDGVYYESPEATVQFASPSPPVAQATQDLELGGPWQLPQPFIVSFDGTQMQTIQIVIPPDRYLELVIPAGALVNSGTVTLFIFPTRELRPEPGQEIVGAGYEMWAVDQNGQEITQFNKNVIMSFPYPTDEELAHLGISENRLIPVYYSTLVGHWILADSYVVDTAHNEIRLQINHFTKFGTLSTEEGDKFVYLPVVLRNHQ